MTTLLRTGGVSTKIISGFHPLGAAPTVASLKVEKKIRPIQDRGSVFETTDSLQAIASKATNGGPFGVSLHHRKGINVTSFRCAHTDVTFPNFDAYRNEASKDPHKPARETDDEKKGLPIAIFYGVGGTLSIFVGKELVQTAVEFKAMGADMRALASTEIKMDDVQEGQCKTFSWRGKPVFVRHRTPQEVARERAVNVSELRHPQKDEERVKRAEWSILVGICTHLGCIPIAGAGEFGGYFCPCHGSHYDASGRIRKGPAPLNLDIPPYVFKDETGTIIVGSD